VRLLTAMRRAGEIPFAGSRTAQMDAEAHFLRRAERHDGTATAVTGARVDSQAAYVEIWLEKDALSGVLYDVTASLTCPSCDARLFLHLLSSRGGGSHLGKRNRRFCTISAITTPADATSAGGGSRHPGVRAKANITLLG